MSKKIRVGIIFGGRSAEHEVSLNSARNVLEALDKNKYDPVLIGIDKNGHWQLDQGAKLLLDRNRLSLPAVKDTGNNLAVIPGESTRAVTDSAGKTAAIGPLDVVFPVLHGTFGEDGTIQGLFKMLDVPFVGPDVLGSAVGMDKDIMKRLLRDAGIPIGKFVTLFRHRPLSYEEIVKTVGSPFFIKPANAGSSVGVHKVKSQSDFDGALKDAFQYDNKVLAEEFLKGREVECSVLGNEDPVASLPGELITTHEFYSYEAKYLDPNGARYEIPAKLPAETARLVQRLAIETFQALSCEGMGRVDFFVTTDKDVWVNEINTIPGFTKISMYPKMWEASGVSYSELVDKLIQLAIARHKRDGRLKTSFDLP